MFGVGERAKLRAGRDHQGVVADRPVAHEDDLAVDVQARCRSAEDQLDLEFVGEDVIAAEEGNRRLDTGVGDVEELLGQRRAVVWEVPLGADQSDGPFETRLACGFDRTQPGQRATDDDQPLDGHRLSPAAAAHSALDSQGFGRTTCNRLFDGLQFIVGDVLLEQDEFTLVIDLEDFGRH